MTHTVNGFTITAHHNQATDGVLILGSRAMNNELGYEYVVATMADISEGHWFSGYYTNNIVNAINHYYEKVR